MNLRCRGFFILLDRERNVVEDRHAVEQRRILKHETETTSYLSQLGLAHVLKPVTVKTDSTSRRFNQSDERLHEDRLSASAFANHCDRLTTFNRDVDVFQDRL